MAAEPSEVTHEQEPTVPARWIFRGIIEEHAQGRIGEWWTTDPFYALGWSGMLFFADRGGELYAARVTERDLQNCGADQAIDALDGSRIQAVRLLKSDPSDYRKLSTSEVEALIALYETASSEKEMIKQVTRCLDTDQPISEEALR